MELITILNRCHRFRGFVCQRARFSPDQKSIEGSVRPRKGSAAICSRCHQPAPVMTNWPSGASSSSPSGDFSSSSCTPCAASIAGVGRHRRRRSSLGRRRTHPDESIYALPRPLGPPPFVERNRCGVSHFLGKVFDAVEHVVTWGLEHRTLGQIDAIGVDEIQYAKATST